MEGLGDVVAKVTDALGIPKCEPCKQRQEKLNNMFPFTQKLTDEERAYLKNVFLWYNGLPIKSERVADMQRCEKIWLRVYNIKTGACKTCNSTYQNNYMNKLKALL